ncbi:MAG: SLBB domain-containing protein [Verrucomicrobiaceae bacterium]
MNKHANIRALMLLCFVLTNCSPYDKHEAEVTARMLNRLHDEHAYMVAGVVSKPGKYPVDRSKEIKVSQAIQQAGGFAQFANKSRVILRRGSGRSMQRIFVTFDKKSSSLKATPDMVIRAGDVIIVEEITVIF